MIRTPRNSAERRICQESGDVGSAAVLNLAAVLGCQHDWHAGEQATQAVSSLLGLGLRAHGVRFHDHDGEHLALFFDDGTLKFHLKLPFGQKGGRDGGSVRDESCATFGLGRFGGLVLSKNAEIAGAAPAYYGNRYLKESSPESPEVVLSEARK